MTEKRLFGTDGIRGKANIYPMTPELALKVGKAVALYFKNKNKKKHCKIVIGKDTRRSGYMLENALTSGILSSGADVFLVGPMPTPAISHLISSLNCNAGIVLSASHNPAEDNGIKVFGSDGFKLSDREEKEIERIIFNAKMLDTAITGKNIGRAYRIDDARGRYIEFVKASIGNNSLSGLKIVLDCANGAAYHIAPRVFSELGAELILLGVKPNGLNINRNCGALHPRQIQKAVKKHKADLGIALDGDSDRVIACDEKGQLVDGDKILAVCAKYLKKKKKLKKSTVVGTVMSNQALDSAMRNQGIKILQTKVGDKYVIDLMRKKGFNLGGEQSGHIIFADYSKTGDAIIAALQLVNVMVEEKQPLSKLASIFKPYPQVLINVKVKMKPELNSIDLLKKEIMLAEKLLKRNGRVLVRYSGTQQIARVMVEGKNKKQIKRLAERIANAIKKEIGS